MEKNSLAHLVAIVVTAAWLISLFNGLVFHDYTGLQYVTPIMVGVCGYLYGDSFFRKRYDG